MRKEDFSLGTTEDKLAIAKRFLAAEALANEFQKAGLAAEIDRLAEILRKPGADLQGPEADLRESFIIRYNKLAADLEELQALSRLNELVEILVNSQ